MFKGWTDVECPYCEYEQEICHDDGYGYEEDVEHEQTCPECDKIFVFTTSISYYYEVNKADCLNGSEHNMIKRVTTYYPDYAECKDCSHAVQGKFVTPDFMK